MDRKKWKSPQAIIIMAIVILLFLYIGIDIAKTKPAIRNDLQEIKKEYVDLSKFLDKKMPEIDSTLRIQADQISKQSEDISTLNSKFQDLAQE
jgi:cob(I)alamin adenosyltransferase